MAVVEQEAKPGVSVDHKRITLSVQRSCQTGDGHP
jgi:hypothetical protein